MNKYYRSGRYVTACWSCEKIIIYCTKIRPYHPWQQIWFSPINESFMNVCTIKLHCHPDLSGLLLLIVFPSSLDQFWTLIEPWPFRRWLCVALQFYGYWYWPLLCNCLLNSFIFVNPLPSHHPLQSLLICLYSQAQFNNYLKWWELNC